MIVGVVPKETCDDLYNRWLNLRDMHVAWKDQTWYHDEVGSLSVEGGLYGAEDWVYACCAAPHDDNHFFALGQEQHLFLTLTLKSNHHYIGDAKCKEHRVSVEVGEFVVVDPLVAHWLCHDYQGHPSFAPCFGNIWVGLQWFIPRRNAKRAARRVIEGVPGGRMLTAPRVRDRRYDSWCREEDHGK